jgi:hypothetical protein
MATSVRRGRTPGVTTANRRGSPMNEREWQRHVVQLARYGGWLVFHVYEAKRVVAGWPDLQLLRPPEYVVVELKTNKGRLTVEQESCLDRFQRCGIETHVWRPCDIDEVQGRLRARHLTTGRTMAEDE